MAGHKATKGKIMRTAFRLVTEKSYSKVSVDEIARTAGVSKGAVFHYFRSKYELAKESLFFALDEMWMEEIVKFDATNPVESAKKLIGFSVDTSLKNWSLIRYALDIYEAAIEEGEHMEDWNTTFSRFVLPVADALRECGVPNPETKAVLLITFIDALGMEHGIMGGDAVLDPDLLKKETFELFVGNYQRRSRGARNG